MFSIKKTLASVMCTAMALTSMPVALTANCADATVENSGLDYDYARALQYSIYFYDANMCGTDVEENNLLSWRGNCHTYDSKVPMQSAISGEGYQNGTNLSQSFMDKYKDILDPDGDGCIDVAGGFHDAGDHVKFGIPENYAAATLGWGYYEFRDSYKKTGQDSHIETILRYFNDYLMKCTFRDSDGTVIAHCYQVGEGGIDHAIWQSPEVDTMVRPAWFLTAEKPQTDYVASAAGSLAINYLNFKDTDPEYAEKSLDYAKALWKFANDNPKELSDNADGPMQFYNSSKWEDDYCWAGAWLYLCTGEKSYLQDLMPYVDLYAPSGYCYNWNDMWGGAISLLGIIDQTHPELDLQNMYREVNGKTIYEPADFWEQVYKCYTTWKGLETPGGYAFLSQWGSARYNTAMQFIGLVYDKYNNDGKPGEFSNWAQEQMKYIMGNNPLNRSYIVGYNENSVKYPHHRAASGLLSAEDTREQRHVLWGALAGGPDGSDQHNDTTNDYIYNEVTIDYNSAFVGACAGLYEFFGTPDMAVTANFPPEEKTVEGEESASGTWIEACGIDDLHGDGSGVTKVSFKVMTGSNKPSDKISVRYYFNTSEMAGGVASVTEIKELYDQSSAEVEGADGVISGPFKYDKTPDTYYVEISWDGYYIANSGKKYQFDVGMYYGDTWNPENDWSYQGLEIYTQDDAFFGNGNEKPAPNICVYDNGVLVGGTEPDGTTVSEEKPTEATTEPTNPTASGDNLLGDANEDGIVDIADAAAIIQSLGNKDKYALSEQGKINADCYNPGDGVTGMDALAIQKLKAKMISSLPEISEK
ncbi:MAG: glycoside hydrolase family 9 protein [Ruminococcus flavefaciens]|nr:glycoside hydrolase family 9 protein [Ruminococcus flavefaciens]MCM1230550.1 glycoside hydrolase family 9 protein [Ruminococcus flavefaciens]